MYDNGWHMGGITWYNCKPDEYRVEYKDGTEEYKDGTEEYKDGTEDDNGTVVIDE